LDISCIKEEHFKIICSRSDWWLYNSDCHLYCNDLNEPHTERTSRKCHELFIRIGCGRVS